MRHLESLLTFADVLRKNNLKMLLKNERYRGLLVSDRDLMLAQLDELEEGLEVPQKGVKRQYALCDVHALIVFKAPNTTMPVCSLCPTPGFGGGGGFFSQQPSLVRGFADVPSSKH